MSLRLAGRAGLLLVVGCVLVGAGSLFLAPSTPAAANPSPSIPAPIATVSTPLQTTERSATPSIEVIAPSTAPTPFVDVRQATRIVITRYRIDLAVVPRPPDQAFPYCDVAESEPTYREPGEGAVTFIYAHARVGMFWPLLVASVNDDPRLIGTIVEVFTGDDLRFTYRITEIHRHQTDWSVPDDLVGEFLVLQTSETASATGPKLMLVARRLSIGTASDADAHPVARPRTCS